MIYIELQLSGSLESQLVAAERSALKQPTEAKPSLRTLIMLPYPQSQAWPSAVLIYELDTSGFERPPDH